jgi:purine-binding chemotaxis protein CheW
MGQAVQPAVAARGKSVGASPAPAGAIESQQYLTFLVGGEMYAVGILNVKEIIEYGQLTEIPMLPDFIRGVINLRGAVVPVIDLAARFGGTQTVIGRRTCIVIVEMRTDEARHEIGIVVDAVSEVLEISPANIEPAPRFGARIRADFIAGMGKVDGKFIIALNMQCVLAVDEMAMLASTSDRGETAAETSA